jgi:cell division FtsZ-interacting protein ZapD
MLISEWSETELKSQLIKELDKMNREQLLLAHQVISGLIAEELIDAVTHDWENGKTNRAAIQKAVSEYRNKTRLNAVQP